MGPRGQEPRHRWVRPCHHGREPPPLIMTPVSTSWVGLGPLPGGVRPAARCPACAFYFHFAGQSLAWEGARNFPGGANFLPRGDCSGQATWQAQQGRAGLRAAGATGFSRYGSPPATARVSSPCWLLLSSLFGVSDLRPRDSDLWPRGISLGKTFDRSSQYCRPYQVTVYHSNITLYYQLLLITARHYILSWAFRKNSLRCIDVLQVTGYIEHLL